MTAMKQLVIFVTASLALTQAVPTCKNVNRTTIVCSPGTDTDYKLARGLVSDNNATTKVILNNCRIDDIEYESFNDLTSLLYLDLSQNSVKNLKLGVLDEPKQLLYLNLSHNQLTTFPLGLFDQTTKIKLLDLKQNSINKLELGIFDPLPDLTYLDLSGNNLLGKDIDPFIFDQSKHITFLDFSRNNMAEAPKGLLDAFESLDTLKLDKCFLKDVPPFVLKSNLKTLKNLILSNNQITSINQASTFINLEGLRVLDLTNNNIETINGNIFSTLKKLQKVEMRSNRLKILPDGLFQNMPKLIVIDLHGNQIEDAPVNVFRGSPLKYLNLSHNKITYLVDNFCLELKNSGSQLKKFYFDSNPWQCSCLLDLIKEVKAMEIDYNSRKYNGEDSVCVVGNSFSCKRHQKKAAKFDEEVATETPWTQLYGI